MSHQLNSLRWRACARRLSGYLAVLAVSFLILVAPHAYTQSACNVVYTISPQNTSAFGAAITIENTGTTAWTSWTLTWAFANGQTISSLWNGAEIQSGANVTVNSESYNGSISAGGSLSGIGFNGTWNGATNAVPTSFAINGTTCGTAQTGHFTLAPSAPTLSIAQGGSGTDTIAVTDVSQFTGSVTLAASGLPTGVTAAFGTNPTTGTSALTLTASSTAAVGASMITITGTSGTLTASTTVALTVTALPTGSFTIAPSLSAVSVTAGSSATDTIMVTDVSPFAGSITLAASGLPSGVTAAFGANPTTGTSVLTLTASSSVTAGTATITITGASGSVTAATTIALTVSPASSFTIAPSASTLTVVQGKTATDTITVTDGGGFTGSVTLAASGLPSGVTAAFGANPTTGTSVLTLTASATATAGTSTVTITGTSGSLTASTTIALTVAASTPSAACTIGYTISPQNSTSFGAAITINNTGTAALSSWTLTWAFANGQAISSLWNGAETQSGVNVTVTSESYNSSIPAGGSITGIGFNGTWNGVTNAVPTSFALNGATCGGGGGATRSFTLAPSAPTLSVTQGKTATDTITVTDVSPFTGSVTLAASGLPTGVTAAFGTNPATGSSVVTFATSSTTTAGTSTVTITGTSGTLTASTTIALTVTGTGGSFTLVPSTSALSIALSAGGTDTINVTDIGGFTGAVTLTASGMPSGVTAAFGTNPTTGSSILTLTASSTATTGAATITIQGTSTGTASGTLSATTTIALTVSATPLVQIAWVSPAAGIAGSTFTIMPGVGASFAEAQGASIIYFGTTAATVTTWAIDSIAVTVPNLAAGTYNVTTVVDGITSNAVPFTITSATPSPEVYTGNSTWFTALGSPYGGCGVPQAYIDSQNFVALNVQNDPGNYTLTLSRPISTTGPNAADIGIWNNGLNCGRWVHITMGSNCNGTNDGSADESFCRGGLGWVADQFNGAEIDSVVADSCQDENSWCRDDPYHLDQAQAQLGNYTLNGEPAGDIYPNFWNNRQISWYFEPAPNYTGDINIGFLNGANAFWSAISVTHLPNGIHGVQYLLNGTWTTAVMDADLGDDYIILPTVAGGTQYEIQVFDVTNTLINSGRIYSFSYPASCGSSCTPALTPITFTTTQ
jgi:cellulose binding protein with CBM2 domain/IPT/TIG domain-containing protein